MKFKEYLEQLNTYAVEHPEALELDVITAKDDEGNGFNKVGSIDGLGCITDNYDCFTSREHFNDYGLNSNDINAICIN